jgi:hypothetical protein
MIIEGAMDLGGFVGVEICGVEVGVVERVRRCCAVVVFISVGRIAMLVGI